MTKPTTCRYALTSCLTLRSHLIRWHSCLMFNLGQSPSFGLRTRRILKTGSGTWNHPGSHIDDGSWFLTSPERTSDNRFVPSLSASTGSSRKRSREEVTDVELRYRLTSILQRKVRGLSPLIQRHRAAGSLVSSGFFF